LCYTLGGKNEDKKWLTLTILSLFAAFSYLTCDVPDLGKGNLSNTADGDTRIIVGMHDVVQPFSARSAMNGKDIQGIQALNLTVCQMVIIDMNGKQTVILDENRSIDILGVSRSDPVILSNVSIEPGEYQELRLVLSDNNTIQVGGETHPIKIPSSGQSGLKLKGHFIIPRGKLFSLMIELDTAESVSWNQGQGYRLQPVLSISNGPDVLGIFRGTLTVLNSLGVTETLLQLYSNNTARLRVEDYPNYTLNANYNYNSVTRLLRLTNLSLDAPDLSRRELKEVMKEMPNQISLPVKQWSLDSIIAIDTSGLMCNLYRVDSFKFSAGVSFTEFTLHIDYPDSSKIGKDVISEIRLIDTGMPPIISFATFEGSRISTTISVKNNSIQGSSARMQISSYLFDNRAGMNTELGFFSSIPAWYMSGSKFSETTNNPWQRSEIFTLIRDAENQEFTISYP
jgi:hypothetical protein